jgi:hypothetical protein
LEPFSPQALSALQLVEEDSRVHELVGLYLRELQCVETALNGDDLKALGLVPSPLYKGILGHLLNARLDGQVTNREEEMSLLQDLLTVQGLSRLRKRVEGI